MSQKKLIIMAALVFSITAFLTGYIEKGNEGKKIDSEQIEHAEIITEVQSTGQRAVAAVIEYKEKNCTATYFS